MTDEDIDSLLERSGKKAEEFAEKLKSMGLDKLEQFSLEDTGGV